MAQGESPDGRREGDPNNSTATDDDGISPRFMRSLQIGGGLLVPATFFGIVCKLFGLEDRVAAEVSITVFLVSAVILFASFLKRRLNVVIPACLSIIMAAVLIHLSLSRAPVPPA